jgi:hypothetical protein
MSKYNLTKITEPHLLYKKEGTMTHGPVAYDLTVGELYPIVDAGIRWGKIIVSIRDDKGCGHSFDSTYGWFLEHFEIVGEIDEALVKSTKAVENYEAAQLNRDHEEALAVAAGDITYH